MFGHLKTMAIFTDDACADNGAPAVDGRVPRGGFAFIFKPGDVGVVLGALERRGLEGAEHPHASNRAGLRAAIAALRFRAWHVEDWERASCSSPTRSTWAPSPPTQRRGWRTRSGQPVKNQDLWKALSDRIGEMARHGCEISF